MVKQFQLPKGGVSTNNLVSSKDFLCLEEARSSHFVAVLLKIEREDGFRLVRDSVCGQVYQITAWAATKAP